MSLSSTRLDAFVATVKHNSFTNAANSLHITQSALSQRIAQLEAQLGLLFLRGPKTLQLTSLAEDLFAYCQQKNAMEEAFLAQGSDKQCVRGILNIAAFSTAYRTFILKRIAPLLRAHPEIQLNLIEYELRELEDALIRGKADYVISTQAIYKKNIKTVLLRQETNTLVQKKHYLLPEIPVYLDHDSDDETTIFFLSQQKYPPPTYQRNYLDNIHLIIEGVKLGLGQAVLPLELLHAETSLQEVRGIKRVSLPVYLMYYEQAYLTGLQKAFLSTITQ